jgi:hypothetical protein
MTLLFAAVLAATPVEVTVAGCSLDAARVRALAELELLRGPAEVRVVARLICTGPRFEVQVDDPLTNKVLVRSLKTSDLTTSAPERFAALALAELVEASWSELLLPTPTVGPPPVTETSTRAVAQQLGRPRVRLGAVGGLRVLPGAALLLGGASGVAHVRLLGPLGLRVDVGAETGSVRTAVGRIVSTVVGAGGFVTAHAELGRLLLGGGAGVRAGAATLVGRPDVPTEVEGRTVSGALGGPAVLGEASLGLGPIDLSVLLEAGWAVWRLDARADGASVAAVGGPWVSAQLGAGVRW